MAKIEYGGAVTDIIGSIGGLTFQHNRSGKIVRSRPIQKKINTFSQNSSLQAFQAVMNFWGTITQDQKTDWNTWADTYTFIDNWGVTRYLNGYNWFMSINSYRYLLGEPMLAAVGSYSSPLAVPEFTPLFNYEDISITFNATFVHSDHYLLIYTTPPVRNNSPQMRKNLSLTRIVSPGSTDYISVATEWFNNFGIPLPIPGGTNALAAMLAVQTIHADDAIASVFLSKMSQYSPS